MIQITVTVGGTTSVHQMEKNFLWVRDGEEALLRLKSFMTIDSAINSFLTVYFLEKFDHKIKTTKKVMT